MVPVTGPRARLAPARWCVPAPLRPSASKSCIRRFVITEKAPTRAFSWLKAATTAFTLKTLLRHHAKRALTPRSLNAKLGPRRKGHKRRGGLVSIVSYSRPSLMIIAPRTQLHVERPWNRISHCSRSVSSHTRSTWSRHTSSCTSLQSLMGISLHTSSATNLSSCLVTGPHLLLHVLAV